MTALSRRFLLASGLSLASVGGPSRQASAQAPAGVPTGKVERLDPSLDALIDADAPVEVVTDGFQWCEGPVWVGGANGFLLAWIIIISAWRRNRKV